MAAGGVGANRLKRGRALRLGGSRDSVRSGSGCLAFGRWKL